MGRWKRYLVNMNARELRRLTAIIRGRKKRRDAGIPRTVQGWLRKTSPRERRYRRVTLFEMKMFWRHRKRGKSLRSIGRTFKRSHRTIARWLEVSEILNSPVDFGTPFLKQR